MARRRTTAIVLALCGVLGGAFGCGSNDTAPRDAGTPPDAAPEDAGPVTLRADAGPDQFAVVGETVRLDASGSTGAVRYQWTFGDGTRWDAPRDTPRAEVVYTRPGRFSAVVQVSDANGRRRSASAVITVTWPTTFTPSTSSTVTRIEGADRVAVVSHDSDELVLVDWDAVPRFTVRARLATADAPRTVLDAGDGWLAVPCEDGAAVSFLRSDGSGARVDVALPRGTRPFGAARVGGRVYVTLQATGELAVLALDAAGGGPRLVDRIPAITDARGVAALPDGRLAVTRWRSPDTGAEIAAVDPSGARATETWTLAVDPQQASDTEIGGVPSYLQQFVVSPTGREAALPSLQAGIAEGSFRSGRPLTFQTTLRSVISRLVLPEGTERPGPRKQLDNRGLASAGVYTRRGDFLFVTDRGARTVERLDALTGAASGTLQDVGYAPEGVALSADDRFLFVDASLSRELVVYDATRFGDAPAPLARIPTVTREPLDPEILRGKQLFNDALDPRLGKDSYIACAHCHLDGRSDGRTWDFTDRGEGLRNTISLLGRAGTGHGPIHWSANFDEVQDFENDLRHAFGGRGLLDDAAWSTGTRSDTLGDPKAGLSADLDALAAYVTSLDTFPESPESTGGALTPAQERGRALFASARLGCATCHAGARLTDSAFTAPGVPVLHDVGTLGPGSGRRRGEALSGLDTPTLRELFDSAPYLHDGSAATLREVLTTRNAGDRHGTTSDLSPEELDDLLAYLRAL
jgi:DNA-binding beta-propeller fold protein YncE